MLIRRIALFGYVVGRTVVVIIIIIVVVVHKEPHVPQGGESQTTTALNGSGYADSGAVDSRVDLWASGNWHCHPG